ncbi:MAG: delta-lactam-biosynthetic de-N-acetylase [Bacillota bacterium]|nr:delta-lactam-biosynthetic de-N-acetylase [Bacillota bacterium]
MNYNDFKFGFKIKQLRKNTKKCSIFCLLLVFSLLVFSGCGKEFDKTELSDLGGVYADNQEPIDFSVEVSGRLSEDPNDESLDVASIISEGNSGMANNKTLRWGIARKPDNKTPDADPGTPALIAKYGGLYLGDTNKKEIYLTFDEGYENGYTGKILDTLRDNNVKAVFFITGPYLKDHQELVRRMIEEGHEVGNHTINHPSLPEVDDKRLEEELVGLDRAFHEKFGKNMKYLRPPKGEYSERTLFISQNLGYRNLFWSFAYDDWYKDKIRGPEYAKDIVLRNLHNGEVMLLHAVSKDNADALDSIIKGAREKGYEFGDINNIK